MLKVLIIFIYRGISFVHVHVCECFKKWDGQILGSTKREQVTDNPECHPSPTKTIQL